MKCVCCSAAPEGLLVEAGRQAVGAKSVDQQRIANSFLACDAVCVGENIATSSLITSLPWG